MSGDAIVLVLFALPILLGLVCLFIKDANRIRGIIINAFLLLNMAIYVSPLAYAYFATPKGENMWSENGPGAALWAYMFLLPLCILVFIILMILKIVFKKRKHS